MTGMVKREKLMPGEMILQMATPETAELRGAGRRQPGSVLGEEALGSPRREGRCGTEGKAWTDSR